MKTDLTVIVLTKNEEVNLPNAINSVKDIARRILVIDSGSSDKTIEIAQDMGAEVFVHEFENYSKQFNWAIDNTGIKTKWIMRLDADEVIPPALCEELVAEMHNHYDDNVNGMIIKLKNHFLGHWLKHGGCYPFKKMMVFKTGIGRIEERMMDEHTILKDGTSIVLKNDGLHYDFKDISHYINKHNWYATREMQDYLLDNVHSSISDLEQGQLQGRRKQKNLYYKFPKFIRPSILFIYRYVFLGGFLDGIPGLIYHLLENWWYRFLVDVKIYEYQKFNRSFEKTGALK